MTGGHRAVVSLTSEGSPRILHPLARQEIERISEEAVRNALRHSAGGSIKILILWGRTRFSLSVCDDGQGIPDEILRAGGRSGHFGLRGMRERAERIGGSLTIDSRVGGGTEVAVSLPARAAYLEDPASILDRLLMLDTSLPKRHRR
ncbi:MAG: hypothetical protein J7500_14740 [Sphingomonas sp.]|uniref:sensor histidine kinase n=1 Tax=Sphingomonas sp. TaxID=28214 RepID=UPI001B048A07|nr:hypothetical protein [Sphingomonas sp.]